MQAKYGTGTITKKNGKWVWVGYYKDDTGKIKRPTKTFKTEKEAMLFQAEQISKTQIKKEMQSEDVTIETVFKYWITDTDISETSKRSIMYNFKKHIIPILGDCKIKHLKIVSFSDYLKKLDCSEKTKYNIYTDLKTIVNYAIDKKIIFENPLSEMDYKPKQKAKKRIVNNLTMDEYTKIMMNEKNKTSFYYNCILFLGETGLRVSELAIKETDIEEATVNNETIYFVYLNKTIKRTMNDDLKTSKLNVIEQMKTNNSNRIIYLNGFAMSAVERQLEYKKQHKIKSDFIFTTSKGTLLEQRNILRAFHYFCENANIEKRGLHSLRKCFINRALQNGIQPFDLAKFTGHSMQTMFKYYHDLNKIAGLKIIEATENR